MPLVGLEWSRRTWMTVRECGGGRRMSRGNAMTTGKVAPRRRSAERTSAPVHIDKRTHTRPGQGRAKKKGPSKAHSRLSRYIETPSGRIGLCRPLLPFLPYHTVSLTFVRPYPQQLYHNVAPYSLYIQQRQEDPIRWSRECPLQSLCTASAISGGNIVALTWVVCLDSFFFPLSLLIGYLAISVSSVVFSMPRT